MCFTVMFTSFTHVLYGELVFHSATVFDTMCACDVTECFPAMLNSVVLHGEGKVRASRDWE